MADQFSVKLDGMDELMKQFQDLQKAVHPDKVEPITLKAARDIAREIRLWAPQGPTGNLRKAIRAKQLKRFGMNPAPAIAAVDRKRAPHAHLVEYGHALVRGGKTIGHVPANPFFRGAVSASQEPVLKEVIQKLEALIEGAAK